METNIIGTLATGQQVLCQYNPFDPGLSPELLAEVLARVSAAGPFFVVEIDLGRTIGQSICIPGTREQDDKVVAKSPKLAGNVRFVYGREAEDATSVVVFLKVADPPEEGNYVVLLAFIGIEDKFGYWKMVGREYPSLSEATAAERIPVALWGTHALIFGTVPVECQSCHKVVEGKEIIPWWGVYELPGNVYCPQCNPGPVGMVHASLRGIY